LSRNSCNKFHIANEKGREKRESSFTIPTYIGISKYAKKASHTLKARHCRRIVPILKLSKPDEEADEDDSSLLPKSCEANFSGFVYFFHFEVIFWNALKPADTNGNRQKAP
jgi:hypothetical protein